MPACYNNLKEVNGAYPPCYGYVSAPAQPPGSLSSKDLHSMTAPPRASSATSRFWARLRPQREKLPRDIKVMLAAAFLVIFVINRIQRRAQARAPGL